ncbi:antibiotic biosynthesis monooxygenase family protein [Actinophytocola sediminis]
MNDTVKLARSTVGRDPGEAVGLTDAIGTDTVTMINVFEVPVAQAARFLERWRDNATVMSRQPGFVGAEMYRALADDARFRFINVARWASGTALADARKNPEWRASVQRMMDDEYLDARANPMVYELALDVIPEVRP